ncbi:Hypothetical_protein [Hexamita inflata]|uniref:Hypothetical_protein n=1 Tax=Hexamita inflata TaxID=28002 RepID=A0AA86NPD1_9EUKA|nr:Hypothetical protein HINF_LOCUS10978 [Hexamita inflata]
MAEHHNSLIFDEEWKDYRGRQLPAELSFQYSPEYKSLPGEKLPTGLKNRVARQQIFAFMCFYVHITTLLLGQYCQNKTKESIYFSIIFEINNRTRLHIQFTYFVSCISTFSTQRQSQKISFEILMSDRVACSVSVFYIYKNVSYITQTCFTFRRTDLENVCECVHFVVALMLQK